MAVMVPQVALKAVFGIFSILFLGWNMKNHQVVFVVLGLIFLIIPSVSFTILKSMNVSWFSFWERWDKGLFSEYGEYMVLEPDTYIDRADNVYINGLGLEITFDENSDKIYIPHQVRWKIDDGLLSLTSDINNRHKAVIVIGTKNPYNTIQINSTSLKLSGSLKVIYFKADTTSITIDAKIEATSFLADSTSFQMNKELKTNELEIDATSIDINTDLYADVIDIDGTSIKCFGNIDSRNIEIDGTSLKLDMTVRGSENINIDGTKINACIKYADSWNGQRYLKVYGIHGNLQILEPLYNTGDLEIRTEGRISTDRKKY